MEGNQGRARAERLEAFIRACLPAVNMKSMADLARASAIDANTFSSWKTKGKHPSPGTIRAISGALNVSEKRLWDAYEGIATDPEPMDLARLAEELRIGIDRLNDLVARQERLAGLAAAAGAETGLEEAVRDQDGGESPDDSPRTP